MNTSLDPSTTEVRTSHDLPLMIQIMHQAESAGKTRELLQWMRLFQRRLTMMHQLRDQLPMHYESEFYQERLDVETLRLRALEHQLVRIVSDFPDMGEPS